VQQHPCPRHRQSRRRLRRHSPDYACLVFGHVRSWTYLSSQQTWELPCLNILRRENPLSPLISKLGSGTALTGLRTGPVGEWTYAHRMAVRIGATALAVIIFIFWPSAVLAIVLAIVLLLVLGFVELIGKPAAAEGVPQAGT